MAGSGHFGLFRPQESGSFIKALATKVIFRAPCSVLALVALNNGTNSSTLSVTEQGAHVDAGRFGVRNELGELLKAAIYKENASEAFYIAAQHKTDDPAAIRLMKELADEEHRHSQMLKELQERDWKDNQWRREEIPTLRISEYLIEIHKLEGASLQDTVVSAMKREQHAVEFHSRLMSVLRSEDAKQLCERLAHEELKHKYRLEVFYDDFFYGED